jgi:hypothetical protein
VWESVYCFFTLLVPFELSLFAKLETVERSGSVGLDQTVEELGLFVVEAFAFDACARESQFSRPMA